MVIGVIADTGEPLDPAAAQRLIQLPGPVGEKVTIPPEILDALAFVAKENERRI